MKELSIEEKAKRYDEAIKRVENIKTGKCKTTFMFTEGLFEYIFPELRESEDDGIREWLIGYFKQYIIDGMPQVFGNGLNVKDVIAWLEKQGGQNSIEEYKITGIGSKNAQGKLGEMIKNIEPVNEVLEQNPAWSEEDNVFFKAIIRDIENVQYISEDAKRNRINWLKFLKERVQPQLKQEWSEEDKERISMLLDLVGAKEESIKVKLELIIFLKSLKNRMSTQTWKPSEEQMEALDDFIYAKNPNIEKHGAAVKSLYQDLKKLREG